MALARQEWHLENNGHLPATMAGFLKHVSTQEIAKRIHEDVYAQLSAAQLRTIVGVDIKNTFANVLHDAILLSLKETRPAIRSFNYVKNFLTDRTVCILGPDWKPPQALPTSQRHTKRDADISATSAQQEWYFPPHLNSCHEDTRHILDRRRQCPLRCHLFLHYIQKSPGRPHCQVCGGYPDNEHTLLALCTGDLVFHISFDHPLPPDIPYSWSSWAAPPENLRAALWSLLAAHIETLCAPPPSSPPSEDRGTSPSSED
ncbi:hypothetical protein HPB48_007133 [Haemaphysalis longicornis]|uniref:Uncharacterized protein n=1 Tax=Haemaphysalis longicornis TaxID=44386 RepID=A0A9J6FQZ5_HAELO|nr:hypothetical protein HPB48_007133 [Haemaphysalis longicornis]